MTNVVLRHQGTAAGAAAAHLSHFIDGRFVQPAIWTQNLAHAHRVAAQVEVGITWVNS